ncbi:MAG: FHA domain-containing protein [Rhodospirillales bacterium]
MSALVRFLTRKRAGGVAQRDVQVAGDRIGFGRAADNDAHLNDPRVAPYQAAIEARANGVFVEAQGGAEVTLNGGLIEQAWIKPGDMVGIGPYDVALTDPPEGRKLAVTVELVRPMGDDLEKLLARSRLGLDRTRLSRRAWSWGLSLLVLALFLIWPVAAFFNPGRVPDNDLNKNIAWRADLPWNSGQISFAHQPIAQQCNRCHQMPFVMVRDEACVACHESVQHHADPKRFKFAELTDDRCEHCHKEHNGLAQITLRDQAFCADCHSKFRAKAPASALLSAADFRKDHPEFRPTVVVDPAAPRFERISLAATPRPKENSGLVFPHDKHLRPGGVRGPDGMEGLDCGSCHAPAPGGALMAPVTMEVHCQRCHELAFEPLSQRRRLQHGNVESVQRTIREYYSDVALRGGFADPTAPPVVRRRPNDKPLTRAEQQEALAWAEDRARQAAEFVFTSKAVCGTCHQAAQSGAGAERRYTVLKPQVAERWLPKGLFRHSAHSTETCQRCHALDVTDPEKFQARAKDAVPPFAEAMLAVDGGDAVLESLRAAARSLKDAPWSSAMLNAAIDVALVVATEELPAVAGMVRARRAAEDVIGAIWSNESSDILLPGIASCRQCHAGDSGMEWLRPNNRAASDCVTCHFFHTASEEPMRPPPKVAGPRVPGQDKGGGMAKDPSLKAIHSGMRNPPRP